MLASEPTILALDFDGVLCDGLIEYFQTAWHTYCQIWSPSQPAPPDELAPVFYRLRPVVETGWEMPVLLRAILLGTPETEILQNWPAIAKRYLVEDKLEAADIAAKLDQVRDQWIATDSGSWLTCHRFYPGVIKRLQQLFPAPAQNLATQSFAPATSSVLPVIVTTKEGRFVRQLLLQQGVELSESQVFGKECQRPKSDILRELLEGDGSPHCLWFIEDRLKTLQAVQKQTDLHAVRLYLADWGYNTPVEREAARQDPQIQLLSLTQFSQDFSAWP